MKVTKATWTSLIFLFEIYDMESSMKEEVNEMDPIRIPKTLKPLKGMLNKDRDVKSLSKIGHGLKDWSQKVLRIRIQMMQISNKESL